MLTRSIPKNHENLILIRQIIRSATSIGANIEEALGGNSKREFIHAMNIAKKEARETFYWLKILQEINKQADVDFSFLLQENHEILVILTSIVKTSNAKLITRNS